MSNSEIFRPVKQTVLSNDWGRVTKHEFDLKRRSGEWQRLTRETYDRGNGAVCLLYNEVTGCVLLTRQFRLPIFINGGSTSLVEAPAGLLDGADPAERMRAELIEETGYEIAALERLFDLYMSPGSVTECLAFFQGNYSDKEQISEGGGLVEEGEDIEIMHVPLTEAMSMIDNGDIRDAKTVILLQRLMIQQMKQEAAKAD